MTDALKAIAENTAQGHGYCMTKRYADIINPQNLVEKSGDEIALEVIARAGLTVK